MSRTSGRASRLRAGDAAALGAGGLASRPVRAWLSGLGIGLGIAAAVAVLGVSASSRAGLLARLARDGNLLTVSAGTSFTGQPAPLPLEAEGMVARIPPVEAASGVAYLPGITVRRTAAVDPVETGGISVLGVQPNLLATLGGSVLRGRFLDAATAALPAAVLGFDAARFLGVAAVPAGTEVDVGGQYLGVIGILSPEASAPALDTAALIGFPIAGSLFGAAANPTTIYLRALPDEVQAVAAVLPFTANPVQPEAVAVSKPSAVLIARAAAKTAFSGLFWALGAVALVVGGVGIANVMVIAVLERRSEIGLRRALGAARVHVGAQFLVESFLLALGGGAGGAVLGAIAVAVVAAVGGNPVVLPVPALLAGVGGAALLGLVSGAYPALRAARLPPTEALRAG